MIKVKITFLLLSISLTAWSQNYFPENGNVGIGTNSPNIIGFRADNTVLTINAEEAAAIEFSAHRTGDGQSVGWYTYINNSSRLFDFYITREDNGNSGSMIFRSNDGTGGFGSPSMVKRFIVKYDGNIGIGSVDPKRALVIEKPDNFDNTVVSIVSGSTSSGSYLDFSDTPGGSGLSGGRIHYDHSNDRFNIGTSGSEAQLIINSSGNLGIGIIPTEKLTVDGKIRCEEIKVEIIAGTGPDYVFEPEYKLRTLQETKEYIAQHKHLPEIPSAREMEVAGVDLGEMNMKLLKKVEELTLYQIELLERLEKAEKKIQQLETK